jgi:hypothetical protein
MRSRPRHLDDWLCAVGQAVPAATTEGEPMIVRLAIDVEADDVLLEHLRDLQDTRGKVQVTLGVRADQTLPGTFQGATPVQTAHG